jgi:hypothetical protein
LFISRVCLGYQGRIWGVTLAHHRKKKKDAKKQNKHINEGDEEAGYAAFG